MINTIPCSISDLHTGKLEMKNQPKILTYFKHRNELRMNQNSYLRIL